MRGEMSY